MNISRRAVLTAPLLLTALRSTTSQAAPNRDLTVVHKGLRFLLNQLDTATDFGAAYTYRALKTWDVSPELYFVPNGRSLDEHMWELVGEFRATDINEYLAAWNPLEPSIQAMTGHRLLWALGSTEPRSKPLDDLMYRVSTITTELIRRGDDRSNHVISTLSSQRALFGSEERGTTDLGAHLQRFGNPQTGWKGKLTDQAAETDHTALAMLALGLHDSSFFRQNPDGGYGTFFRGGSSVESTALVQQATGTLNEAFFERVQREDGSIANSLLTEPEKRVLATSQALIALAN